MAATVRAQVRWNEENLKHNDENRCVPGALGSVRRVQLFFGGLASWALSLPPPTRLHSDRPMRFASVLTVNCGCKHNCGGSLHRSTQLRQ